MQNERFVSYAQNLEDVMLWRALHDAVEGPGFYIDVGAADPVALSVTKAFYDRGWHGIDVEPLPDEAARLEDARPRDIVVQAALTDAAQAVAGTATFHRVTQSGQSVAPTGLSTLDPAVADAAVAGAGVAGAGIDGVAGVLVERIDVPLTTLAAVCRAHVGGPVHFLKIDAEGAEAAVLGGADFAACRPWIVLVEATAPGSGEGTAAAWEPGLLAARYDLVWFDGLNRFYLAREHADLARHFTVQPNVWDDYRVDDPAGRARIEAAEAQAYTDRMALAVLRKEAIRLASLAPSSPTPPSSPHPPPSPPVSSPSPADTTRPGAKRRLVQAVYRVLRPLLRPILWRGRQFLVGDIRRELFELGQRQDLLLAQAGARVPSLGSTDADMVGAMERLLLTLALEQGRTGTVPPAPAPAAALPNAGIDG